MATDTIKSLQHDFQRNKLIALLMIAVIIFLIKHLIVVKTSENRGSFIISNLCNN